MRETYGSPDISPQLIHALTTCPALFEEASGACVLSANFRLERLYELVCFFYCSTAVIEEIST